MGGIVSDSVDLEQWIVEAKESVPPEGLGMILVHNGVVRGSTRSGERVSGMRLETDRERLAEVVEAAAAEDGIGVVRVWVNEGELAVGDDIMFVLIGGNIRETVIPGLERLVRAIKTTVVREQEIG